MVLQALAHWVFLVFHRIAESCENFSFHMPESTIPKVGAVCKHSILAPVCALGWGHFHLSCLWEKGRKRPVSRKWELSHLTASSFKLGNIFLKMLSVPGHLFKWSFNNKAFVSLQKPTDYAAVINYLSTDQCLAFVGSCSLVFYATVSFVCG